MKTTDMDDYPERQLAPGIYITDFRSRQSSSNVTQPQSQHEQQSHNDEEHLHENDEAHDEQHLEDDGAEAPLTEQERALLREALIERIETTIFHLKRSNNEMAEFDPEGTDEELQSAIYENLVILQKKTDELERLRREQGSGSHASSSSQPETSAEGGLFL
jgi:hypothetical protein